MSIKTRLRSMQKSLVGREKALFWLKHSQQRGGYLEYWKHAEVQGWPSETEEGGLLYYLAIEVNTSLVLAFHGWREVASWAALLGISMIEATSEGKTGTASVSIGTTSMPARSISCMSMFTREDR